MSKKNRNFRKKDTNLGIKVGDWFEEINPDSEIKTFLKSGLLKMVRLNL